MTLRACRSARVAAGRIGTAVLRRLKPFDVGLHYTDRHRLPADVEQELGVTFHPTRAGDGRGLRRGDDQRAPSPGDREPVRRGADRPDEARLVSDQHGPRKDLRPRRGGRGVRERAARRVCRRCVVPPAGARRPPVAVYAPPRDDPHTSGTSLSAQARYAAGTREILECWLDARPIREEYLIVDAGRLAGAGAHSYSEGNATAGSEEAARFRG